MTPGQQRKAQRAVHLAAGLLVVGYVYAPLGSQIQHVVRLVILPVLVLTGVAMWQAARFRRMRRGLGRARA